MEDSSRPARLRRRAILAAAGVATLAALGLGIAWASSATAERPGQRIGVDPVVDGDPLLPASPPASTEPEPSESPRPVPAPPPVDVDDDDPDDPDDDPDDD